MFGYVKAYRPMLRVCELDLYKGVYCGLCKTLTERYGYISSLPLSYDFVFLTIAQIGLNGCEVKAEKKRCPTHLIRKTSCISCMNTDKEFEYSADAQVILTYHKLCDDLYDHSIKNKLRALAALPFYIKPYRQASKHQHELAKSVRLAMKDQRSIERSRKLSLDMAAQPTADIMKAIFRQTGGTDPQKRDTLAEFGYMLGRYVYLADALDDIRHDYKNHNYNPLITRKLRIMSGKELSDEAVKLAADKAQSSIFLTLGSMADVYNRLDFGSMQPIMDNIVFLGLKNSFFEVRNNVVDKKERKRK